MKATTQQIAELLQTEMFEDIENVLESNIGRFGMMEYLRNEITSAELIRELPQLIDIIRANTAEESVYFDTLPYSARQNIYTVLTEINALLVQMTQGTNSLATLIDRYDSLRAVVLSWRLDFKSKKIPLYDSKIKQYNELTKRLNNLIKELEETEENRTVYNELIGRIEKTEENLRGIEDRSEAALLKTTENKEQTDTDSEEIKILALEIKKILEQSNEDYKEIDETKEFITEFFGKIDKYLKNMDDTSLKIEKNVKDYSDKTTEIIRKNEEQTKEIDNQLGKATGVSLFKSFQARRKALNTGLNNWLIALGVSTAGFIGVSMWIFYDVSNKVFDPLYFGMKIAISLPLLFVIGFVSSRYTKERRLVEEYAFKASVALALKPYADLIENDSSDEKYKDFLIKTIENIFDAPTDKVFGLDKKHQVKEDKFNLAGLNEMVDTVKKIKETLKSE
ncbi:MAG: hypothetical protein M0P91_04465 [Sulfuricurvum sp.]|jgi:hypothetical protein|uniref:hypothetical protein n=1 Tax=Sulfuricurvum sp. TaxID=2025608 RepID=UPI0025F7E825|nr:hypothetical protein [Sulfuricurvum sp.]MCK9372428.1 hypothetical protein [Sulfuricurvum sp.]